MARKMIDCREFPSDKKCTIAIAADTDDEVVEVAVLHAVQGHGHSDTPELRQWIRESLKEAALP